MGMESPELLLLVENCPKGAETLITRIIHILTDKCKCFDLRLFGISVCHPLGGMVNLTE